MKTKTKKRKAWVEKTKKRAVKEIVKRDAKKEIVAELPDVKSYPRAEQPKVAALRTCQDCGRVNPTCWTDEVFCVWCFHRIDGSERRFA